MERPITTITDAANAINVMLIWHILRHPVHMVEFGPDGAPKDLRFRAVRDRADDHLFVSTATTVHFSRQSTIVSTNNPSAIFRAARSRRGVPGKRLLLPQLRAAWYGRDVVANGHPG